MSLLETQGSGLAPQVYADDPQVELLRELRQLGYGFVTHQFPPTGGSCAAPR
jgi:hypothetical protein